MSRLRCLAVLAFLLVSVQVPLPARAANTLEDIRMLAQAGAAQLALQRVDALQPADAQAPDWSAWEYLRLQLLDRLGRHEDVLRRAGTLPVKMPAAARSGSHAAAARAALLLNRPSLARDHAGRALWSPDMGAKAIRDLRLLVIHSQVLESRFEDAWRSMLRFEQDYRPLDQATATRFVEALLDAGMVREALTWLGLLDERGATRLRLHMHAGLVTAGEAVSRAQSALSRSDDPAWWRLLLDAADHSKNSALRLTALEQLLEIESVAQAVAAGAARLWSAYASHVHMTANARQLLSGDEAGWLEFAIRRSATEVVEARAYFAYLARHGSDPLLRERAQERLAAGYAAAKLPRVALRVFGVWPGQVDGLRAPTRRILGRLAEGPGDHPLAFQYLEGLPAPEEMPAAVWQLRMAALALRAGRPDAAVVIVQRLVAGVEAIPSAQLAEWILLAQQLADHGLHEPALMLFGRVLPHAAPEQWRTLQSSVERIHRSRKEALPAADFYLRQALSVPAAAAEARLKAGLSLARAGLLGDARAQFDWVLKNAGDPELITVARRELGF
ncbi:MAG: hypothetical protein Q8M53_02380 [Burkholderiales bacterium]|nr:hypothetical protein [Burkholderiales bacterium]